MSEKTIDTLLKLLEEYRVEIPILQRDYAQGRQDEHAKMVRSNLLKDMKSAILNETLSLDLNFVYGKAENDKFIPLDGQQRLTTLFLLYLYAFRDDNTKTDLLRKFTYETRKSSRDFLEKLTENRTAVFTSALLPSEEVEDSEWFISTWKYDPTIQSALTMLNDIKSVFADVENLDQRLSDQEAKPIIFNFLEMKYLGMEDSLYIKLNARGKPLTSFENFKARLIGRLKKLRLDFTDEFEQCFDREWTDLFWSSYKEDFDMTYLTFFGVLFMNRGICSSDTNWSNTFDFEKIDDEAFEIIFHTLNFLSNNQDDKSLYPLILNALSEKRTYYDRILFHAATIYLHKAKGIDNEALTQWIRIIKNLTLNSQIDKMILYRRAIEGVDKLSDKWSDLIDHFSQLGTVTGFSSEQIKEEQNKAQIILKSEDFAKEIYRAEQHPYFSGQIRSALHFALDSRNEPDINSFVQYWDKITELFDETKPKYGNLMRQALLTFGDYTLSVGEYRTLCVDDPKEAASTPSLKRLFSNNSAIVKQLLDGLDIKGNIESQMKDIIRNSTIPASDWRHCFLKYPRLFGWMSSSHLRLRKVNEEFIIISNKASNGFNYEVFLTALYELLRQKGVASTFDGELGTWGDRYLCTKGFFVRFKNAKFIIKDKKETVIFETKTDNPIDEVETYIMSN